MATPSRTPVTEVDSKTMHRMHRIAGERVPNVRRVMPWRSRKQQNGPERSQRMFVLLFGVAQSGPCRQWSVESHRSVGLRALFGAVVRRHRRLARA